MGAPLRGSLRPLGFCLALTMLLVARAWGADMGSVSGVVFSQGAEPVADALVTIAGDRLPIGRTVTTGDNGTFRFDFLLPGTYSVTVEKTGVGTGKRQAIVEIGRDTQVDFIIGLVLTEEVSVSPVNPIVDVRGTEVSANYKDTTLNALPLERTYRGLFQLIPGVADNRSIVGPAAGGTRQDNTYLIDGANIANPLFGYLGTEINELDIAEVNLKRAGITAEFGRTAGAVTNAVSRSGSNQLIGIGRIDWLPQQLVADYQLPDELLAMGVRPGTFRDPVLTTEAAPAIGIGGPLVHDHLFFYASARYSQQTKWDRVNKAGTSLPDEVRNSRELYGKITAGPTNSHQLNAGFRYRPSDVAHASLDSNTSPALATDTDNGSRIASVDWAYFMSARRAFNVQYLYMNEKNVDVPVTDLGYQPPFDPTRLALMGQYTDPLQADLRIGGNQFTSTQNYRRHEIRGTHSEFFEVWRSSHAVKAGVAYEFGEERFERLANGWGIIANTTSGGVPVLRARYYAPQPAQIAQGDTYAFFAQDQVVLNTRTTVNVGVLLTRDAFSQEVAGSDGCPASITLRGGAAVYESHGDTCTFLRFGFSDEIQPRLGVSYQVRDGSGDKAYAHWGRYYNMDQKSTARSLAPNRAFQTQTIFDLTGAVISTAPLASTTGKLVDPAIEPIYSDEIVVGYSTPVARTYAVDMFFMSRSLHNVIEDVPSRVSGTSPDSGPYVAANLPCVAFAACQSANAERTYRAFTVDVRRQMTRGFMTNVSYTWSRFEGNYDLDYALGSVFNTSSVIQDAPGTNVEDPYRFGPLFEDRPHVFKVFTSYAVTSQLTASAYMRVQSGTPWAARGRDWAFNTLNFLEPAGSHRNPTWTNLDLMAAWRLPFNGSTNVSLEARLLNVINNQTQLSTDAQQYLDLTQIQTPPYFGPYTQPNPFFGTGNAFAPPRRLHVALVVGF